MTDATSGSKIEPARECRTGTGGYMKVGSVGFLDVERIELLRGPQGTLFGSGSLSGALRILTRSPDLARYDASTLLDPGLTRSDSVRQRYGLQE